MSGESRVAVVSMPEIVVSPAPDDRVRELSASSEIDALEAWILQYPQVEPPLVHRFTKGMYIREIHIPAGDLLTSKIHRTEHPFVLSKGSITVWSPMTGLQRFTAPYTGITKPGTRRVLFAHDDVVWSTFHVTDETDIEKIEDELVLPYEHGKNYDLGPMEKAAIDHMFLKLVREFAASKQLAAGSSPGQESTKPMKIDLATEGNA